MNSNLMQTLDTDQRRMLDNVRAAAERIWSRPLHLYYTDHTVDHSERVIALLDGLTEGMMDTGKRLSPAEVYVLLAAAYLHDIGMQNERFADGDLEQIRASHHEQTAEMIYSVFEDPASAFAIPLARDPGLVEAIALVARGHRKVDLSAAEYDSLPHGSETIRLRLLAALLCFADELDIDHRRVDLEQLKVMRVPDDSLLHWWKCQYVSGVRIADGYIRVAYRFPQARPDYEGLIVPLVETDVRNKLADLEEIFWAHGVKVALGKPQVRAMRLVQPLPADVEALARAPGTVPPPVSDPESTRRVRDPVAPPAQGPEASQPTAKYNIHIGHASGLAIGDGAQVVHQATEGTAQGSRGQWNRSALRDLLTDAFTDPELTVLCYDHFPRVHDEIGEGMGKSTKVQRLLEYCIIHDEVETLLGLVREHNPAQYARFGGRLRR